jgi:hypothetical protein
MRHPRIALLLAALCAAPALPAQPYSTKPLPTDKFRQLTELLPTPNDQRTASGAPGRAYWQQRADYVIEAELDDTNQSLSGRETITYTNHSPDALAYLWLQLDANIFAPDSDNHATSAGPRLVPGTNPFEKIAYQTFEGLLLRETSDSRLRIAEVTDGAGRALPHTIVKTMMRVDLPQPLAPGATTTLRLAWSYVINDGKLLSMRSGWEYFKEDKNYLYEIAQWFPRMAVYGDSTGWQHKQYLGRAEFALEFGDYLVKLTVPDDHVVAATGELQNPADVLSPQQRARLKEAETAKRPVFIVTPEEARRAESGKPAGKKTWVFAARNVRDFAFASSRKFIWDAMGAPGHASPNPAKPVMAMSFYPKEGEALWSKYSTHAIIQTLDVYSRHTFPYPYPVAQSINGPIGGMEYPMICFNGPRPEKDGTYPASRKYGLISVIIHEVGHNYFPMIVNSDERIWTWMDEGLNTFCQFLAEQAWEKNYPSRRGEPRDIIPYMTGPNQVPIMTDAESVALWGPNGYGKPATALNILRETVLGRELFDHAFRTYAQRWAFKRPYPADFFRTMEDASGVDLDWFWRGWFYTNDHTDISIEAVRQYTLDTRDPAVEKPRAKQEKQERPETLSQSRNAAAPKRVDTYPELQDFYNRFDEATVLPSDRKKYETLLKELKGEHLNPELLRTARNFYVVELANLGGLVMPVILRVDYTDGSTEELRIPAEIWRVDNARAAKFLLTKKEIRSLQLDPHEETADANVENNFWPRRPVKSRFQLFKDPKEPSPMQELERPAKEPAAAEPAQP